MFNYREFNFDIHEMIDSFNFFDFVKNEKNNYRSGVLVITDKQYILSYTNNFGKGDHFTTLARIFKDLNGGGKLNYKKSESIINEFKDKYIVAKLYFSYNDNNNGVMFFENLDNINNNNYEVFLKFYEDYNDIIKVASIESNFFVSFYKDEKKDFINSQSLDELMHYLKSKNKEDNILYDKESEIELGVILNNKSKQLKYDRRRNG